MEKSDILIAFNEVVESTALWEEMANILFSLGAEIFETKYGESLYLHQELVWKLIVDYRRYPDLDDIEFSVFVDTLHDLAQNRPFKYTDLNGQHQELIDREQILDVFLSPDFVLKEIISINPDFLNNY